MCRKAQESQREMKLLLDMYRSAPKEQRDKVQLMAAEKKSKSEVINATQHSHLPVDIVNSLFVLDVGLFIPVDYFLTSCVDVWISSLLLNSTWSDVIFYLYPSHNNNSNMLIPGRGAAAEAKGAGGAGEEGGQEDGR